MPRVISSWKSEWKLWLKFQLNQSIFLFLFLKSVQFWLFKPIFWHLDPESGSGFRIRIRIQAQIECGSNRIRIRNTAFWNKLALCCSNLIANPLWRASFIGVILPVPFLCVCPQLQKKTWNLWFLGWYIDLFRRCKILVRGVVL